MPQLRGHTMIGSHSYARQRGKGAPAMAFSETPRAWAAGESR